MTSLLCIHILPIKSKEDTTSKQVIALQDTDSECHAVAALRDQIQLWWKIVSVNLIGFRKTNAITMLQIKHYQSNKITGPMLDDNYVVCSKYVTSYFQSFWFHCEIEFILFLLLPLFSAVTFY
jgi:hypothetical protein